jgi:hypothetical protein
MDIEKNKKKTKTKGPQGLSLDMGGPTNQKLQSL